MKATALTLTILSATLFVSSLLAQDMGSSITARQVVERIKVKVTCPWAERTNDTFKAGDPDTEVTGIAVTFMATYDVLKRASRAGCNFIITHEPTYYHGADDKSRLVPDAVIKANYAKAKELADEASAMLGG